VSPGRGVTVRGVLILLAVAGGAYVALVTSLIALRIAPTARALNAHSESVLREHGSLRGRLDALATTISTVHRTILETNEGDTLSADVARTLAEPVRAQLDSVMGVHMSARLATIPADMRLALAAAVSAEQNAAASVVEAIAALHVGRQRTAVDRLREADSLRVVTRRYLDQAQYLAIVDVVQRENDLVSAARAAIRIIGWWALAGVALFILAALVVQRRLYRPLAELESSLADVTAGNLSAAVTVQRPDELGRLGAHFNRMTQVLRERAEEEQRRREDLSERFGQILEESTGEILLFEQSSLRVVRATRGARLALGYTMDDLRSRTPLDLWRRLDRTALEDILAPLRSGEETRVQFSTMQTRRDGSIYPVEATVHLSSVAQPPVFVAFILDLSARERAQELSARLRDFALEKGRVIGGGDLKEALAAITRAAAETLRVDRVGVWRYEGYRIVSMDLYEHPINRHSEGHELLALDHPAYFAALGEGRTIAAHDAYDDLRTCQLGSKYMQPAGICSMLDAPVRVGGQLVAVICHEHVGEPRRWTVEEQSFAASMADLVAIAFEASERTRTQEALLASEARYRAAFEQAGVGIAELDLEGLILRGNRALGELLGMAGEKLSGKRIADLTHPDDRAMDAEALRRMLLGRIPVIRREKRWLRKDGVTVWTSVTTAPVHSADGSVDHIVSVVEDVTERRRLQSQLAHVQKMESIGRLAGGIAHDFNNLLTAILGYVELSRQSVAESEPLAADLREIEMASRRGAELTRQLLTFARRQVVEPRPLNLNDLARSVSRLLARLIGERIELVLDLDPELSPVLADSGQLEQVIINMAVNARDAMPNGGKLTLQTRNVELDQQWVERHPGVEPGSFVCLSVKDTGTGMDAQTLSRIFEPFFTTKDSGMGTGLGLATSYGIVRQAGGDIEVFSEPGKGTVLQVHLPFARTSVVTHAVEPRLQAVAMNGKGRVVMVVDDEPQVRTLMERAFQRRGFKVLSAASAEDALPVFREYVGHIDLLVTDIILPGKGGRELADTLTAMRPGLPVLYVSGYTESQVEHAALLAEGTAFLPKPFTATELTSRASELLTQREQT
jgi:PAS domain S-box-containing protein